MEISVPMADLNFFADTEPLRRYTTDTIPSNHPRYYFIADHGNYANMENAARRPLFPNDLTKLLNEDPASRGKSIVLFSCNVGSTHPSGGPNFAQQLANLTGKKVIAPNNFSWIGPKGFDGVFPLKQFFLWQWSDRQAPGDLLVFRPS